MRDETIIKTRSVASRAKVCYHGEKTMSFALLGPDLLAYGNDK
jgi:hypothetical protein